MVLFGKHFFPRFSSVPPSNSLVSDPWRALNLDGYVAFGTTEIVGVGHWLLCRAGLGGTGTLSRTDTHTLIVHLLKTHLFLLLQKLGGPGSPLLNKDIFGKNMWRGGSDRCANGILGPSNVWINEIKWAINKHTIKFCNGSSEGCLVTSTTSSVHLAVYLYHCSSRSNNEAHKKPSKGSVTC